MMDRRLVSACVLGFIAGAAAIPLSVGVTGAVGYPPQRTTAGHAHPAHITLNQGSMPAAAIARQRLLLRTASGPHPFGTTPATVLSIRDNGCKSFVTTYPVDLSTVQKDDPRFQPCTPTANNFQVEWSGPPTSAQNVALVRVLGNLAQNHPAITLAEAEPLIRAAIAAAQ